MNNIFPFPNDALILLYELAAAGMLYGF